MRIPLPILAAAAPDTASMLRGLIFLLIIMAVTLVICIIVTVSRPFARQRKGPVGPGVAVMAYGAAVIQLVFLAAGCRIYSSALSWQPGEESLSTRPSESVGVQTEPSETQDRQTEPVGTDPAESVPTEPPFQPG